MSRSARDCPTVGTPLRRCWIGAKKSVSTRLGRSCPRTSSNHSGRTSPCRLAGISRWEGDAEPMRALTVIVSCLAIVLAGASLRVEAATPGDGTPSVLADLAIVLADAGQ